MILKVGFALLLLGVVLWQGYKLLSGPTTSTFSLSTDTHSSQFITQEEAIVFLEPYIKLTTKPLDLAYHIVYHDNSQGIPGPSDWDMKLAVKVLPEDIDKWLEGASVTEPFDMSWVSELLKGKDWNVSSELVFYTGLGEQLAVYKTEGVILKWLSTF
jgi:hypothetical protein